VFGGYLIRPTTTARAFLAASSVSTAGCERGRSSASSVLALPVSLSPKLRVTIAKRSRCSSAC
jgi:hypothetical protein